MEVVLMLLLGAVVGVLAGLFGIGGGVITIPALVLISGLSEQSAQGTASLMVLSNLLMGLWKYHQHKQLDWRAGILMAITSIPANLMGSWYAIHITSAALRRDFAVFLFLLGLETARRAIGAKELLREDEPVRQAYLAVPWALGLGVFSGVLSGMFGIGGGLFSIAVLAMYFGYTQVRAQGACLISVVPGVMMNLMVYNRVGDINWSTGVLLALGGFLTVPLGVKAAMHFPDRRLKWCFAWLCIVSAAGLSGGGQLGR